MISLTEKAVSKVKEISESGGIGHTIIRLKVLGGGCAGFTYDMCYDEIALDNDEVIEQDGVTIRVDAMSYQYLEDVVVDFVDGLMGAGFKFLNPKAKGSCGCGSSFDM